MPERETPDHASHSVSGDLFGNLPEPAHRAPVSDSTPPVPGSRRARREKMTNSAPVAAAEQRTSDEAADLPPAEHEHRAPMASPLDDLFQPDHDDSLAAPRKKRRRTGCLVGLIIVLVLIGGAVYGGFWAMNNYGDKINELMGWGEPADWEPGLATGEATVTVFAGDTGSPVSTALYEAGVTKTEDVFYDYLVNENVDFTIYPGIYTLQQKMTAAAALDALNDPANKVENSVGTAEGGTVDAALVSISEAIGIPLADLEAAVADPQAYGVDAETLEGWLFPAVYTFDPDVTAQQVIQRMVDRTREILADAGVSAGDENRVLTIASIIQREGRLDDFAKVSRVIQNRLDDGMMLQMDSTSQYGYGELHAGVVSTSAEAQYDDNPWNTYVHTGLPIGPIANPSEAAIKAAMNPVDGPWFYFVTVNLATGETVFSVTNEEHEAAKKQWDQWCQANPGQGC